VFNADLVGAHNVLLKTKTISLSPALHGVGVIRLRPGAELNPAFAGNVAPNLPRTPRPFRAGRRSVFESSGWGLLVERELYPFEEDIARRFSIGGKMTASPKAEWIRGYLLTFGGGYPYGMWREYRFFAGRIGVPAGSYASFARSIWILKRLGLIRPVRVEPRPRGLPRTYYSITPGMEYSPIWMRPEQYMYPSVDWTIKPPELKRALRAKYR